MKPSYGIDAPGVLTCQFLISFLSGIIAFFLFQTPSAICFWMACLYVLPTSFITFLLGCWMIYGMKYSKPKIAQNMIKNLNLKGDEKVLDLGCGKGLFLVEAAKHLSSGKAFGIDIWSFKDQSKNSLENTLKNARIENVKDRVEIHTGDITSLSFPDESFDVVISSLCIHNLEDHKQREKALLEMLRVLKPKGKFVLLDIQYGKAYADFLVSKGISTLCSKPNYAYFPPVRIIEGKKILIDYTQNFKE